MFSLRNLLHGVRIAIVAAVALATAQIAHAVSIDIRTAWDYNGIGSPNQIAGHNQLIDGYNEILGVFSSQTQTGGDNAANLIDFPTKANTGVGVTWAGWGGFNGGNSAAFSSTNDWVLRDITGAQLYRNYPTDVGGTGTVTFTGLTSGNNYKVEVVLTGDPTLSGGNWVVDINSLNADHSFLNTPGQNAAVGAWNAFTNGTAQRDWLVWDAATAVGGSIVITFNDTGSPIDGLAAIRITGELSEAAVPEPSTFVLAALGLAGLGLVAWRKRK